MNSLVTVEKLTDKNARRRIKVAATERSRLWGGDVRAPGQETLTLGLGLLSPGAQVCE